MPFEKGNTVMLGRTLSDETRQKLSDAHKGSHPSRWGAGFRKGNVPWNKGTNFARNAYFAGLFDGEGSAFITGNGRSGTIYRKVGVAICMKANEAQPLPEGQKIWGGSLHIRSPRKSNSNEALDWRLWTRSAEKFLISIKPFLRVKREVADLVLKYRWLQVERKKRPDGSISPEDWQFRIELEKKIKLLNSGVSP